ncbi:hypothetical protein [Chitinophaga nivalis]|uniref:Lipoprotein n=1 Tax=Chitinophaga nivalis TaxID=2991709 RepID=A0ABT3ITZ9_9BACT|nr:hypothetical protein [Chitinophaga nivalis]MCW3462852.1 hypothetical protein [Chitinophaga nivalis]MCW3487458.1 hypothetical protein [Chitinophaga nivalis]
MKSYFSTNRVLAWTFTGVAIAALFFACKKDAEENKPPVGPGDPAPSNEVDNGTIAAAGHEAKLNLIYTDLFDVVLMAAEGQGVLSRAAQIDKTQADAASCPDIRMEDQPNWPKDLTVIYGGACRDNYGVIRSGTVTITLSAPLFKAGSVAQVKLDNYKIQGVPVSGNATINMISYDNTNGVQYSIEIAGGKVNFGDTLVLGYTTKRTIKQIAGGASKANRSDDEYSIEGEAKVTYEKGGLGANTIATYTTISPLIKAWICNTVSKGQLKVVHGNKSGILDYGTGVCDHKAVITVGDKWKEIDLTK